MYIDIHTYTYMPPSTATAPLQLYKIYAYIDIYMYIDVYVYRYAYIIIHASQHYYSPTAAIYQYICTYRYIYIYIDI